MRQCKPRLKTTDRERPAPPRTRPGRKAARASHAGNDGSVEQWQDYVPSAEDQRTRAIEAGEQLRRPSYALPPATARRQAGSRKRLRRLPAPRRRDPGNSNDGVSVRCLLCMMQQEQEPLPAPTAMASTVAEAGGATSAITAPSRAIADTKHVRCSMRLDADGCLRYDARLRRVANHCRIASLVLPCEWL